MAPAAAAAPTTTSAQEEPEAEPEPKKVFMGPVLQFVQRAKSFGVQK